MHEEIRSGLLGWCPRISIRGGLCDGGDNFRKNLERRKNVKCVKCLLHHFHLAAFQSDIDWKQSYWADEQRQDDLLPPLPPPPHHLLFLHPLRRLPPHHLRRVRVPQRRGRRVCVRGRAVGGEVRCEGAGREDHLWEEACYCGRGGRHPVAVSGRKQRWVTNIGSTSFFSSYLRNWFWWQDQISAQLHPYEVSLSKPLLTQLCSDPT